MRVVLGKDAKFLACALAANADFFITGDQDFPRPEGSSARRSCPSGSPMKWSFGPCNDVEKASGNSPCKNLLPCFHKQRCGANFSNLTVHDAMHGPHDYNLVTSCETTNPNLLYC